MINSISLVHPILIRLLFYLPSRLLDSLTRCSLPLTDRTLTNIDMKFPIVAQPKAVGEEMVHDPLQGRESVVWDRSRGGGRTWTERGRGRELRCEVGRRLLRSARCGRGQSLVMKRVRDVVGEGEGGWTHGRRSMAWESSTSCS